MKFKFKLWNAAKVVSLSAILISVMTLWLTFEQLRLSKEQQRLSVLPYLSIVNYNTGGPDYKLMLFNNGIGPAFVESVKVHYKGEVYETDIVGFLYEQFPEAVDSLPRLSHSNIYKGMMIPAGQEVPHLNISNSVEEGLQLLSLLQRISEEEANFEIVYSSIYKERWLLSMSATEPKKLR